MATRHPLILSIYISLNISPLHDHLKKEGKPIPNTRLL